jgi:hypothetical protein
MRILSWKYVAAVGVLAITLVPRPGFADCKPENPNMMPGIETYAVHGMVPEGTRTTPVTISGSTGATTEVFLKCQKGVWVTVRAISTNTTPSH